MTTDAADPLIPPTKPPSPDRLRRLQCHAAECHCAGAVPEAISAWSGILRFLLPHIVAPGRWSDGDDDDGDDNNDRPCLEGNTKLAQDAPLELWIAPVACAPNPDDAIFALFPYVLVYATAEAGRHESGGDPSDPCVSGADARRVGAGVAYNLALAYQMQALQGPRHEHSASMRTALGAYKAARDMLLSVRRDSEHQQRLQRPPLQPSEDDRLLLLAITNNEGQIQEALYDRDRVAESLRDLRRGLAGATNPAGVCGHFAITDALYGEHAAVQSMHSPAA